MNAQCFDVPGPTAALRAALASAPLLGFDTARWAQDDPCSGAKPAFVGVNVGPAVQKQSVYALNFDAGTGQYTIRNVVDAGGYSVRDAQESGPRGQSDDLSAIGDTQPDRFVATRNDFSNFFDLNYIGKTTDVPGSAADVAGVDANGNRFLLSSRTYAPGAPISLVNSTSDPYPTCFTTGTRIRTVRGEVPVEDLRVGDLAVTAAGEHRPIRWIGARTLAPRRHARPSEVQPVRIRAGAFGENRPARDLRLSPGHAVALDLLGEVLIPAFALVDGVAVVREDVDRITYWHVELDAHDLLVAEGQPAESYLDMGNRGFFADSAIVALAAAPDAAARTHADFCRPFHATGPLVALVRARLAARAAAYASTETPRRAIARKGWAG